jgi:hypothetical protein
MSEPLITKSKDGLILLRRYIELVLEQPKYASFTEELSVLRKFRDGNATINELRSAFASIEAQLSSAQQS